MRLFVARCKIVATLFQTIAVQRIRRWHWQHGELAMIRKIKRRFRKYRLDNQPRYPELFVTLDYTFAAAQTVAVIAVFGIIIFTVTG